MNRPLRRALAACALAALLGTTLWAVSAPRVQFTDTKLKNGLRVIISEDHAAPVFSFAITYNVGSRNERKGRTGFAHLFEHMMFKGSENVGSGEHFMLVFNNGGNMNGSTNKDRTNYFEALPANQLDLALFLESDRMRTLAAGITPENLKNQIDTVQEERRQGVDNQAYGKTDELLEELAYQNPNYKHSVIGSMTDLSAATVEDVQGFFTTYYAPNNAVVAIVGDVKPAECLAKVRQYFESIPSQTPPPEPDMTEPPQAQEKRQVIDDRLARLVPGRADLAGLATYLAEAATRGLTQVQYEARENDAKQLSSAMSGIYLGANPACAWDTPDPHDTTGWRSRFRDTGFSIQEQGGAETSKALDVYLAQKEVSAWETDRIRNYQDLLRR